jgi:chemotaxis family two-component system sensor kinase Cph1
MPRIRWLAVGLGGAVVACLLFATYLMVRTLLPPSGGAASALRDPDPLESLALVAALGAALALLAGLWVRNWYVRLIKRLGERVLVLRENPAPNALHDLEEGPDRRLLGPILDQLRLLSANYRRALAEVIRLEEALDEGPSPSPRGTSPPAPTRYIMGSSRHRMVARLTPNLQWATATAPLQEFLGLSYADLVGRPFLVHVHPDDAGEVTHALGASLKDGEGHNIICRLLVQEPPPAEPDRRDEQIQKGLGTEPFRPRANGKTTDLVPGGIKETPPGPDAPEDLPPSGPPTPMRIRYVQMDVMTYYGEKGAPLQIRCHLLDVTSQVRTEQELRRRTEELSRANAAQRQINADLQRLKESYRDLYHNAPVLYFSLDPHGRLVACNNTMLRTLGYPREELIGQPYTRLLPSAGQSSFLENPTMFHVPGEVETRWIKADGTVIDVWIGTTTIRNEQGHFVRSRNAALDVSERRSLEAALRAKTDKLTQANTQLRRINQELEEFTYVVSHDLKEPLRTLEAFSNFLAQDYGEALVGDGQVYITHLMQSTRRLGALIDDLLRLSRAGRVLDSLRGFDWEEVLHTVRADLADLIQRRGAVVRVEGPLPPVLGDPERIGQLLMNLVGNGLKYNESARPEVVLAAPEAQGQEHPDEYALFVVRDNGVGIEPAYHEQIFRVFRRLHRQDEVAGTGAGLAICRKIVEAHGGRMWVKSNPGQGASFFFTLPRPREGKETPGGAGTAPRTEALAVAGPDRSGDPWQETDL